MQLSGDKPIVVQVFVHSASVVSCFTMNDLCPLGLLDFNLSWLDFENFFLSSLQILSLTLSSYLRKGNDSIQRSK